MSPRVPAGCAASCLAAGWAAGSGAASWLGDHILRKSAMWAFPTSASDIALHPQLQLHQEADRGLDLDRSICSPLQVYLTPIFFFRLNFFLVA